MAEPIQLAQFLAPERVVLSSGAKRDAVLEELIGLLGKAPTVTNLEQVRRAVFEREAVGSTGIGLGIAVPHVRLATVQAMVMAAALTREPIDFGSLDGAPVRLVLLVASPIQAHKDYLRILARIALLARNQAGLAKLYAAQSAGEVWDWLKAG
jgi:mannitol/fructose-specific phosphotransferase system IIA component (Ntr-type)